ncbi:MAG TPA: helicase-associated domain-containing protein, partial [Marmoricola sp.]|nr:helicase-associated domain-containing protein [Marmoricola sp.]
MTEPRSLADHLRGWSDAQRMQMFEWRPDLIAPAPRSSAQLAARATTTASVARALDFLTAWELRVLAALLDGTSARTDVVAALPGSEAAIDRLSQLALIWGQDRLRPVGTVAQIGISPDPTATPTPPTLATTPIDPTHVARAAGGAAFDFVRRTELLLEHWGLRPPGVLKAGGLGVRELRASAVLLGVEAQDAALVVEVAAEARLIGQGQSRATGPAWMPTTDFDDWMLLDNPQRWARLAQAWLDSPRFVAGWRSKDTQGRSLNAFDPALSRRWLPQARRDVLGALALLGPDEALAAGTGAASLVAYLRWSAPRRPGSGETVASSIVAEAARLGLVALGALTPPGRALLARDDAAAVIEAHLPRPVEQILIQADLTAVAPGPLTTEIGIRLGLVADVESRGAATVYRFTQDSI